jgi:hypothetical protein
MLARCLNPNNDRFSDYGGRGITICEEWLEFSKFLSDMGDRPSGTTLDRIDCNIGYNKDNCRWTDPKTQANNRRRTARISAFGHCRTIPEWAECLGVMEDTIRTRLRRGMPIEKALSKSLK